VSEVVVLDAVGVAMVARAVRDVRAGSGVHGEPRWEVLPEDVTTVLRTRLARGIDDACRAHLDDYARELDEIAEAALALDQHEHEIDHQLRWWGDRVRTLEGQLSGHPADDVDVIRELALYRGRISGATALRAHYAQQRAALVDRNRRADARCAEQLGGD